MKTHIIKIGNSKGIRIPKTLLEQCNFQDEVEIDIEDNTPIIHTARRARVNWDSHFYLLADH